MLSAEILINIGLWLFDKIKFGPIKRFWYKFKNKHIIAEKDAEIVKLKSLIPKGLPVKIHYDKIKDYEAIDWETTIHYALNMNPAHAIITSFISNPYCPKCQTELLCVENTSNPYSPWASYYDCPNNKCNFQHSSGRHLYELKERVKLIAEAEFRKKYPILH